MLPVGVITGRAQALFQQLAVGQAGQVVVVGCPVQLTRMVLERRDIRERCHVVILPRFLQMDTADGKQFNILFTVFPPVPDFAPPVVGFLDGAPHGAVVLTGVATRAEDRRVQSQHFLLAVAGDP